MTKETLKKQIYKALQTTPFKEDVAKLSLFGSYLRGQNKPGSDVDLLFEFLPSACISFFDLSDIKEHFEKNLNKKVDVLTPEAISHYFRQDILNQAELIYEKR